MTLACQTARWAIPCLALAILAEGAAAQQRRGGQRAQRTVNQTQNPILESFTYRSIGPAVMGGRTDDIEAVESATHIIFVGLATGGVWKTTNNGTSWTSLFDEQAVCSIGDLAVSQQDVPENERVVWAGTGEPNNRQSSSYGSGIYKSTDGGSTWELKGLTDTRSISRILIDPNNDNIVYVAAGGSLFGASTDRGIYKTTDGGNNWQNVNFIDENTGFTDLIMHPTDSRTLIGASYQRRRTAFGFNGGGAGSGLWMTTDAGANWSKIEGNGMPPGPKGRIGISWSRSNPSVVYAQIEMPRQTGGNRGQAAGTGARRGGGARGGRGGGGARGGRGGGGARGARGGGGGRRGGQQASPPDPARSGVWRSNDGGVSWSIASNSNNRPMYYSQIRVDPSNPDIVWAGGLNVSKSTDGGVTFPSVQNGVGHVDNHAIWVDPNDGDHTLLGNDGGFNMTYDGGATWDYQNHMAWGQFYAIGASMERPYKVYGGLQDNNSWGGPSMTRSNDGPRNADWYRVGGGDGFYTQIDPSDPNIVYSESQNGNVNRLDLGTGASQSIKPRSRATGGGGGRGGRGGRGGQSRESNVLAASPGAELQYRWNWNTPIHISPHNPRTLYVGGNALFKSVNRGDTWFASADLTRNIDRNELSIMDVSLSDNTIISRNDGISNWGTLISVAESPKVQDVVWVGSDDGVVQVSRDGGRTFTNVTENVPGLSERYQVIAVEPSHFEEGTCYIALSGHMADDFSPYLYVTRDFGASWTSVSSNLPTFGNVRCIAEDLKNPNLIFIGTEFGLFATLDGGGTWEKFMNGLPTVRVDDLLIHPRDNDLIVGTHGRSIWIMDDITGLQQLTSEVLGGEPKLLQPRETVAWANRTPERRGTAGRGFAGENPRRGAAISYYLGEDVTGDVTVSVHDASGQAVWSQQGAATAGLHRIQWGLNRSAPVDQGQGQRGQGGQGRGGRGGRGGGAVNPGTYLVKLTVGDQEQTATVRILEDIWAGK